MTKVCPNFIFHTNPTKKKIEKIPHKKTDKILSWRKTKFGGKDLENFVVAKLNCFPACFGSAGHG